jgi:hypothetical protein
VTPRPPDREPQPPPQTRSHPAAFFSLAGRADPVELIVCALNASGATGVGRILDYRERSAEPGRS